jgi:hypothetical protein
MNQTERAEGPRSLDHMHSCDEPELAVVAETKSLETRRICHVLDAQNPSFGSRSTQDTEGGGIVIPADKILEIEIKDGQKGSA